MVTIKLPKWEQNGDSYVWQMWLLELPKTKRGLPAFRITWLRGQITFTRRADALIFGIMFPT